MLNIEREKEVLDKFWSGEVMLNMSKLTDYGLDDLKKILGDKVDTLQGNWAVCFGDAYKERGMKASPFDFIGVQRYMIGNGDCVINHELQHWNLYEQNDYTVPIYDLEEDAPKFLVF